ncbi:hypothetical protein CLF_106061 [Clonorchis sinensis]|uniref:Uncharacterized protein n=1 Tax=Clonorchis sinensis TaxID=79923 RepID=G7YEM7_CLOSI|nr:hypothetical protein CLF_106061 [Clonorchis sinensis]
MHLNALNASGFVWPVFDKSSLGLPVSRIAQFQFEKKKSSPVNIISGFVFLTKQNSWFLCKFGFDGIGTEKTAYNNDSRTNKRDILQDFIQK